MLQLLLNLLFKITTNLSWQALPITSQIVQHMLEYRWITTDDKCRAAGRVLRLKKAFLKLRATHASESLDCRFHDSAGDFEADGSAINWFDWVGRVIVSSRYRCLALELFVK